MCIFFLHDGLSGEEIDQVDWGNEERVENRNKRNKQVRERHREEIERYKKIYYR